jgi:hypothetical protein
MIVYVCNAFANENEEIRITRRNDYLEGVTQTWIIKSWASRSRTRVCVKRIGAVQKNLSKIFAADVAQKSVVRILILKDQRSFLKYSEENLGETYYGAGYWSSKENTVVVCDDQDIHSTLRILSHELTHYYIDRTFSRLPLWLNEGLCEYISINPIRWGKLKGDYPSQVHLKRILQAAQAKALISIPRLVGLQSYLEGHERGLQYAQCWGLVYFFFHGMEGKYAPRFIDYIAALKARPETRFEDFFDLNEIETLWIRYFKGLRSEKVKVRPEMRSIGL